MLKHKGVFKINGFTITPRLLTDDFGKIPRCSKCKTQRPKVLIYVITETGRLICKDCIKNGNHLI